MLGYHCTKCAALFAEMHSAIMEANAITEHANALRRAEDRRVADLQEWWETKKAWENARRRWLAASTDILSHLAKYRSTPTPAKRFAPSLDGNKNELISMSLRRDKNAVGPSHFGLDGANSSRAR